MSQVIHAERLEPTPFVLRPPFPPTLEAQFQRHYYLEVAPTLRYASLLFAALFLAFAVRDYLDVHSLLHFLQQNGAPAIFYGALFAATFWVGFSTTWQVALVVGAVITGFFSLNSMGTVLGRNPATPMGPFAAEHLFFGMQTVTLMVAAALTRVQFRFALILQLGLLTVSLFAFALHLAPQSPTPGDAFARFLQPILVIVVMTLLGAYVQEKLSRQAFYATHLLDEERNGERRKRLETEGKLNVLSQAIGGIVHDLGNPLAAVQMGAGTLEEFLQDGETDQQVLLEFTEAINHGAQMLNCLRLSLMEQTRVLDGKPTPVDLRPVSLRQVVEAGLTYQKTNYANGRTISVVGEEVELYADVMKLTTVFMNLIGNALKYSDGEVQITWRRREDTLLVAVLDQGVNGRGLTAAQAQQLFVPFGRLETHAKTEGTGLGLLSARKVVEAHGAEIFIEGYVDGNPGSAPFAASKKAEARMVEGDFRTAFVITGLPFTAEHEA